MTGTFRNLRGGEHEFGVLGRLFQRLQEGVERLLREHVNLVDDIDFVACARRRVAHAVGDLAHVVDTGMRRGIHFEDVDVPAFHDRLAVHAHLRHVDGRSLHRAVRQFVIQCAGENARGCRLADAANTGENPGLGNTARLERIRNGADHGLLADQIVEIGGTIFAGEHAVAGAGRWGGCAAKCETRLIVLGRAGNVSIGHRSIRDFLIRRMAEGRGVWLKVSARAPVSQRSERVG